MNVHGLWLLTATAAVIMQQALNAPRCAHAHGMALPHTLACHTMSQPRFLAKLGISSRGISCGLPATGSSSINNNRYCRTHASTPNSNGDANTAGNANQHQPSRGGSVLRTVRLVLAWTIAALRAAAAIMLLVAISPYLLSSRIGTRAVAAAASRVLPGDVRIQRLKLGWAEPLAVEGLAVYEAAAGSSRQLVGLERFSSAEPLHAVVSGRSGLTLTLTNPSIDCSLADSGNTLRLLEYLQSTQLWHLLAGKQHRTSISPAAAAVAKVTASGSSGGSSSVHSHPIQVTSADEVVSDAGVGVAGAGAVASPQAAAAGAAGAIAAQKGAAVPGAAAAAADLRQQEAGTSSSTPASTAAAPPAAPPALAAAAAAGASALPTSLLQRLTHADAVSHVSLEVRLPRLAVFVPDGKLLLPVELQAAVGEHLHAVAAAGSTSVQELAEELDEDSAWLELQHQHQFGQQQQQQQQREQQEGSVGSSGTAAAAAAVPELQHEAWPLPSPDLSRGAWANATPLLLQVSGDHVSALLRGWHIGSWWRLSQSGFLLQQPATASWLFTPELAELTLSQFNPLLEQVAYIREGGQLVTSLAPAGGRVPAMSGELLVSPVKLVVGKGNLLSQVYRLLGMHGRLGGSSSSSSSSSSRHKPWTTPGSSSSSSSRGEQEAESTSGASGQQLGGEGQQESGSSGSEREAAAAAAAAAAAVAGGSNAHGGVKRVVKGVEVWSGPLRVAMEAPGRFRTNRVDMLLGSGRNSLHVALWGTVDSNSNTLAMTIGLPASTLAKAGIRNLPPSYMLPVAVGGTLHKPQIEWNAAVRQLAVLSAMQLGKEAWRHEQHKVVGAAWGAATHHHHHQQQQQQHQGSGGLSGSLAGLFGAANRALGNVASTFLGQVDDRLQAELCEVPPPVGHLPWEEQR